MDILESPEAIDLNDPKWKIYTNTMAMAPQYVGPNANVKKSMLVDGCIVMGEVENSVLSHGVEVGEGSSVKNSVIMPNVKIGKNVIIEKCMIGEGAIIEDNACLVQCKDEIGVVSEFSVVKSQLVAEGGM
jgi:glucose-1-phosphate adenylyltransferase